MSDNPNQNKSESLIRELITGAVPLDWANFTLVMIIVLIAITFVMSHWIGDMESTEKIDFIRTIAITAGGIVGIFVAYTGHKRNILTQETNEINRQQNEESNRLSKSSQLDDRFARALEMLSHESSSVISGGLYLLRDVALEAPQRYLDTVLDIIEDVLRAMIASISKLDLDEDLDSSYFQCESEEEFNARQQQILYNGDILDSTSCLPLPNYIYAALSIVRTLREKYSKTNKKPRRQLNLSGLDFLGISLAKLDLRDTNFENARFDSVDLREARLSGSTFKGSSFYRCLLIDTNFSKSIITDLSFDEVNAENALFINVTFHGETKFKNSFVQSASFDSASIWGVLSFSVVNTTACTFKNTELFGDLKIEYSVLDQAKLENILLNGSLGFDYEAQVSLKETSLHGTVLPVDLHDFSGIKETDLCDAYPVKYLTLPPGIPDKHREVIYESQKANEESRSEFIF